MPQFPTMRYNMVQGQILPEGVTDPRILEAFSAIPREKFVPHQLARIAYMDAHFPLYKGRVLLRPATLARLLEACGLHPSQKILYVGCATGYGPALLAQMGLPSVALDCDEIFTQEAERILQECKLPSRGIVVGSLEKGWEAEAPYDRIIIEGTIDFLSEDLLCQLGEGGQVLTFMLQENGRCGAVKYIKASQLPPVSLFEATVPYLPAFKKPNLFVFSGKKNQFVYGKN